MDIGYHFWIIDHKFGMLKFLLCLQWLKNFKTLNPIFKEFPYLLKNLAFNTAVLIYLTNMCVYVYTAVCVYSAGTLFELW